MDSHQEEIRAMKNANLGKMKACLGATEPCLEKMEATIKACQEQMKLELRLAGINEDHKVRSRSKKGKGHSKAL
jgi:hypothetical protein